MKDLIEHEMGSTEYQLRIDCPPGDPRPGDLLPRILKDTGIHLDADAPASTFFGCWTWPIPSGDEERYEQARPLIERRLRRLYRRGVIRYAQW